MNSNHRRVRMAAWSVALLLVLLMAAVPQATRAQTNARYFPETGHWLKGAFRYFWETNGGAQVFGLPITEEFISTDNRLMQYFERSRFELVGQGANSFVELGLVGVEASGNRNFPSIPPWAAPPGSRYFHETQHSLQGLFLSTWEARGGTRIFGLPISQEIYEQIDGQFRLVQWFQRARFELWPEGVRFGRIAVGLAPPQLLLPWPPNIMPPGPLNADGYPRPPAVPVNPSGRATLQVNPTAGAPGTRFEMAAAGYVPGERIIFWLTQPNGTVTPLSQVATADAGGGFPYSAHVSFSTSKRDQEGIWYVTGQGLASGRTGVAAFQLGGDINPTPENPTGTANVRVTPENGFIGTVFTLLGDGFKPRENVSVWLTFPDQSVRSVSTSVRADKNGSITPENVRFTFGYGAQNGRYYATAQGRESGLQGIGSFTISGGAPLPPGPPAPPAQGYPPNLRNVIHYALGITNGYSPVTPLANAPGASFRVVLGGFAAGERVGIWLTAPNNEVQGLPNVTADSVGGIAVTYVPASRQEGDWKLTAKGDRTGKTQIVAFKVTRDYIAPLGTGRPPNRNGTVTPSEGGLGTVFRLTGTGFRPNEPLDHWITSPDGVYYLVGRVYADSRGRIGYTQALSIQFGPQNPTGVYGYNYQGVNSGVRTELYMTYTGN